MKTPKILVVYKRSIFEKNFQGTSFLRKKNLPVITGHLKKIRQAHQEHYQSFKDICDLFRSSGISFETAERKEKINFKRFDVIVTLGGDGTFMEVSHQIKDQLILGVNSAPNYSIGRYCCADAQNFPSVFKNMLEGRLKTRFLQRLQLRLDGKIVSDRILNDFLVAHANPSMMSRYLLKIGSKQEEQKSSGMWISTPSGSSGAIKSAGGRVISLKNKTMVYLPRELHQGLNREYILRGGVLRPGQSLQVTSMMKDGMIYGDGGLTAIPFPYGAAADISFSQHPLKTFQRD